MLFRKALAIQQKLCSEFPAVPQYRIDFSSIRRSLALLLEGRNDPSGAKEQYKESLAIVEKLVHEFPVVPSYRSKVAELRYNFGRLLDKLGRLSEAEEQYREAVAIYENLIRSSPPYRITAGPWPSVTTTWLLCWVKLGNGRRQTSSIGKAWRSRSGWPPNSRLSRNIARMSRSHINLGILLGDLEDHSEAMNSYRKGLVIQEKLVAEFPTVPEYRKLLAKSFIDHGRWLAKLRKWPEAVEDFRKGLNIWEKLAGEFPTMPAYRQELAQIENDMGLALANSGNCRRPRSNTAKRWRSGKIWSPSSPPRQFTGSTSVVVTAISAFWSVTVATG